jgi:peptidoglycan/xylan/chitin deacetylase (PgdA/CDA1 family)
MKKALFSLLYVVGLTSFAMWWHRKRVVFLCYHGVTKRPTRSPDDPKGLHVNHLRFRQHLQFLRLHYRVISLSDYITAREDQRPLPHYSAVLTFDDGFRNFVTTAAPALAEHEMPATVFLVTDNARDNDNRGLPNEWTPADDRRYLSWNEAKGLKRKQNVEFGSHTCSHSGLLTLSLEDARRELLRSYEQLVSNLAVETPILSYPKGQYSPVLADEARKVGYAGAVTTDRGRNEADHDLFTLGRTLIGGDDDLPSFAVRVSGLRWWLASIRSLLTRHVGLFLGPTGVGKTELAKAVAEFMFGERLI